MLQHQILPTPIEDLQPGDIFKEKRQRKFRSVNKVIILPDREGIPQSQRGCVLVIYDGCNQLIAPKGYIVQKG